MAHLNKCKTKQEGKFMILITLIIHVGYFLQSACERYIQCMHVHVTYSRQINMF